MDDFNGSSCSSGPFPLITRLSDCFKRAHVTVKRRPSPTEPTSTFADYYSFDEIKFSVLNNAESIIVPKKIGFLILMHFIQELF